VQKFSYGYSRYTFPFGAWPVGDRMQGRFMGREPDRGDVIVFKYPQDNSTDFIKRLVGMPGETVQMKDGRLYINGQIVPRKRVGDYVENFDGRENRVPQYEETLPNGKTYFTLDRDPDSPLDNTELYRVPAGHYFMMGDNRDNSDDSRQAVGYVPYDNLEGKAMIRFFSTDGSARFWEVWKWPFSIRYSRILSLVN
jgi:signal peptidase I